MILLSVIIPTRNRADLLHLTLQSLQSQTLSADSFEVLVIDNGSTDNTKQIIDSFQQEVANIRYFFEPTPGLHVGRHLGMKMAKSEILVYADDDIEAFPTWLESIEATFQDPDVALVGGKNLPKFESEPPGWIQTMWKKDRHGNRILGYLSILDLGEEKKKINPYHVFGCNFSIRKSILLAARGFHPDSVPQDLIRYRGDGETYISEFIEKEGRLTIYNPKASVYHAVPKERLTLAYFNKRAYNEGISRSFTEFRRKHTVDTANQLNTPIAYTKAIRTLISGTKIGKVFNRIRRRVKMSFLEDRELVKIYWQLDQAMIEGWTYHRKAMKNDPGLRSYVLKDHYLD